MVLQIVVAVVALCLSPLTRALPVSVGHPQDMLVQVCPIEQLVLSVQVVKHAGTDGLQAKAPQSVTVPAPQLPRPSQKRVDVSALELEQVAAAQTTEPSWNAHPPEALHLPVVPQPMLPWFTQVPVGSVVPGPTCVQVPSEPGRAQLWHCVQAAEPQHTFSTQWPLLH
jgi:hypothetical protein